MSSYGNRCHTPERELIALRLMLAAMHTDDDEFAEIMDHIETCDDMAAVAALLAEQLAEHLTADIEYDYDRDITAYEADVAKAARPIVARTAELEQELGMRAIRRHGFGTN
jgi:hypothetical protein